jgi:hypothetical protein
MQASGWAHNLSVKRKSSGGEIRGKSSKMAAGNQAERCDEKSYIELSLALLSFLGIVFAIGTFTKVAAIAKNIRNHQNG